MSSPEYGPSFSAFIFDVGDILYDATGWRRAVTAWLQERNVDVDYPQLCERWERRLVPVYIGKQEYWQAFHGLLEEFGLSPRQCDDGIKHGRELARRAESRQLFPHVLDTLAALADANVPLGVLSDTESTEAEVRSRLDRLGVGRFFSAIITSRDVGFVKPEREAYECALTALGARAQHSAFVGHDLDELEGAVAAGLSAIAFNSSVRGADYIAIETFDELIRFAILQKPAAL